MRNYMVAAKISAFLENAQTQFLPGLTIDCVIFGYDELTLKVLLLKISEFEHWMLPGGYIYKAEDVDEATHRIIRQRTGIGALYFQYFALFGSKDRTRELPFNLKLTSALSENAKQWLNQRFVTAGYLAFVQADLVTPKPDLITEACAWFPVRNLPPMILDHADIIETAKHYVKKQVNFLPAIESLLPKQFTMLMLQKLYESILDEKFDRGNFQRKILKLDVLIRHQKWKTGKAHKAPYLYSIDQKKYSERLKDGIGL